MNKGLFYGFDLQQLKEEIKEMYCEYCKKQVKDCQCPVRKRNKMIFKLCWYVVTKHRGDKK